MDFQKQREDRQERRTLLLIAASCICLIIQLYAIPRDNTRLMSLANQGLLLLWLGIGGFFVIRRLIFAFPAYLFSIVEMLLCVLVSFFFAVITSTDSLAANITALINFLVLPVTLLYSMVFTIPEKAKKIILLTGVALSFVFIDLYHSNLRHVFTGYYGDTNIPEVTLGYPNPNQAAIYLFVCVAALFAGILYFKNKTVKILLCLDLAYILWILVQTRSRTAALAAIILFVLTIFAIKQKLPKNIVAIVVLIPFVYAVGAIFFELFLGDVTLWGESLFNGRESIFDRYINNLSVINFLLGDFKRFHFQNLHNGYVSIAATAGVFTVAFFITFIKRCLEYSFKTACTQKHTAAGFVGFLCVILYTSTEAAAFVGGSTYAFLVCMLFMLCAQPYAVKKPQLNEVKEQ